MKKLFASFVWAVENAACVVLEPFAGDVMAGRFAISADRPDTRRIAGNEKFVDIDIEVARFARLEG
ncbi:MAG TPA: hypothetical protein VIN38_06565 [Thiobacillus sp.]